LYEKNNIPLKAIIDLGTNTFHLLIAEVKQGAIREFYKLQVPVKIGRGGINNGQITPDSYQRGMVTVSEFKKYIDQFQVTDVTAFATSAIRTAKNGGDFVREVEERCGIKITTIDGDTEAKYIYTGVLNSFKFPAYPVLVMDIGGGSVEFIIGTGDEIHWKQSFEIGAARLLEQFHQSNPIAIDEKEELKAYLAEVLKPLDAAINQYQPTMLVGSAGSFETLVDIVIKDLTVIPNSLSKQAFEIRREDFDVFVELMKTSTTEQRRLLRGMTDFRVEMITVAALLMDFVVNTYAIKRIVCSNYSLKEGVLFS
jgi:exopolyphosphatase/guanosine-5'-triphosphate,3'-diphosphate pyrophosphatase